MDAWIVIQWHYRVEHVYGIFHSEEAAKAWIAEAFPDEEDQRVLSIHQVESTAP